MNILFVAHCMLQPSTWVGFILASLCFVLSLYEDRENLPNDCELHEHIVLQVVTQIPNLFETFVCKSSADVPFGKIL